MTDLPDGYKMTDLGPLPEEWQVAPLSGLARLRRGSVNPEDVPHLRYEGLEHLDLGEARLKRWGAASHVRSAKNRFVRGDVLYGKLRPYLDKGVLAEWEGICSTDVLVLIPNEQVYLLFLVYLAHTKRFLEHAVTTTTGVNHPRTSWTALRQLGVCLPPLLEQRGIAHALPAVDGKLEAEEKGKQALDALFKSLLHNLMTGKVRVNAH